ncbi:putative ubiquinone biosynthesis monooxgenase (Coq6) [Aspergillus homomorphus CBS 101889]|uniref:Ubiquinone biosynthesis monooxygenase COQ6, mitochondrial n=1 Tax=Aspergillus homomorphus (strain CBS 101889) TaxID=1450537 RepID=A0A395IAS8_ASPHC|nr:ubiquinone biosynthesis monooxygenase [Aspergillus homomorphus CBS 101889]RAL17156.1 ubiquinone biosynthesis monooxygenase [Aspergillus homomorphus CBS 101889]
MRSLVRSAARPYVCPSCQLSRLPARRRFASHSTPSSASPEIYDVVCVGGGPAGLGLLAALRASPATSKLKVALVETQDLQKAGSWSLDAQHYSNRVSSLTPSSVSFLQKIGVWDHVDTARVQPYQEMQVWDGETGSRITFDWSMETSPFEDLRTVATMTENSNLVRALLSRIAESGDENLSIFSNTTVSSIANGSEIPDGPDLSAWPVLSLAPTTSSPAQPPKQIAARLLVGADGINSPVRRFADISTSGWDYDRHGVVATLSLSDLDPVHFPLNMKTAYQRFLPALGGPIALLPLPNNNASLVWSTTVANAAYLKSLPPRAFIAMVNAAFRLSMTDLSYMLRMERPSTTSSPASSTSTPTPTLDPHEDELTWRLQHTPQPRKPSQLPPVVNGVQEGTVASFPLRFRHASSYISPRVALVGDAAHVIHPLAGQGLNLGLGDVAALARTVQYAATHGMDVGDILTLERYAGDRFATNAKIGAACDVLHKLYNVPGNGPVAWARSFGLDVIDKVPFVKGLLMKGVE